MKKLHLFIKKPCVQKWDWGSEVEVAQQWGTGGVQQGSSYPAAFLLDKACFWAGREVWPQVTMASWFLLLCLGWKDICDLASGGYIKFLVNIRSPIDLQLYFCSFLDKEK